jgi:GntR family transcriptional repressor for pyruvate dehydrogenase complex
MSKAKQLTPIKPVSTYELITQQILRAIHMGLLVPGDRLPSERALAEQLGVARLTVREAIRVLAHEGRITVRRGVNGGTWIRAQDVNQRELVRLAADVDRAIEDVYEFREVIERAAARLAATHAKHRDVRRLRGLARQMSDVLSSHVKQPLAAHIPKFLALDSQFHTEIARLSMNQYIADAVERALAARYAPFGAVFRTLTADANDGHDELIDAIATGDGAKAESIMGAHIAEARVALISLLNRHIKAQTPH